MKINIIGGGPAGLYLAILLKKADASREIAVYERDGANDTFGWGIVFSDQTFNYLRDTDAQSFAEIIKNCEIWDNVDVVHRGEKISIRGNKFSGIGRLQFLNILQARCRELGVQIHFHTNINLLDEARDCDLLVGADGANSFVRRTFEDKFKPSLERGRNKYIWLGTHQLFHGLTLTFRETDAGLFIAHSYKFNRSTSTFIVECAEEVWLRAGFNQMSEAETCRRLEEIFRDDLGGHPLLTNNFVKWLNFVLVKNQHWFFENVALIGDALHTAHFSIGSGTKLALEDSIALAKSFDEKRNVTDALAAFELTRKPIIEAYQAAAYSSLRWFERARQRMALAPIEFAYELMTRSTRVTHEKLKRRDPEFVARYENWQNLKSSE
jgi:anthraniloyl-CoA monooxygenase